MALTPQSIIPQLVAAQIATDTVRAMIRAVVARSISEIPTYPFPTR